MDVIERRAEGDHDMDMAERARAFIDELFSRHDRVFLAFSGGRDSLALAKLCEAYAGRFRLLWANTGFTFPHVEALIRAYGECFGLEERRSDLLANWKAHGLPSDIVPISNAMPEGFHAEPRLQANIACCASLRSGPLLDFLQLQGTPMAIIHGQRHEDGIAGLGMSGWRAPPCVEITAPIADWTTADVQAFLDAEGVELPSHYGEITDSLDCWICPAAFGEVKGRQRAAYMRGSYPDHLAMVLPAVERSRAAVRTSLSYLDRSVAVGSARADQNGEMPGAVVLQRGPSEGDCLIAALATVLGRSYAETAVLLGLTCDDTTLRPQGLPGEGLPLAAVPAALSRAGIAVTLLLSPQISGASARGGRLFMDADLVRPMLDERRAVVVVETRHVGRSENHALAWTQGRLLDCRGPELKELHLEDLDILAVAVLQNVETCGAG